MPHGKPPEEIDSTPGLAGGPGPTPPGVEDGTPQPRAAAPETLPPAEAQREEAEVAEKTAGTRRAEVPGLAGEREGKRAPDPDAGDDARERRTRR